MKKFFVTALSLVFACPVFSQTLAYRHEEDASLQVGTNYYYEGKPALLVDFNPRTAVALEYALNKDNGEELFQLDFLLKTYEQEFSFDKNANLYIRTFNDKVITIHQLKECGTIKRERERVSEGSDSFYYYVYPDYAISKEDLTALMDEGAKKLSFMTTRGYHTLEFEKDTIGSILKREYNLLMGKTDFNEGF